MIKYTPSNQLTLSGFSHPFDQELSSGNRWVKLSKIIPWDALASVYLKQLSSTSGRESIDVRMVIAAIVIKHKLHISDRETVAMISENIYLQYFCGLTAFQTKEPFHPTVFVDIRKRMGANSFDAWNALIIEKAEDLKPKKNKNSSKTSDGGDDTTNKGTLKIDATVANQKIVFPTDAGLLNTARKQTERIIDFLYKQAKGSISKPRDYRRVARTEYLVFSKKRRKTKKEIRKFIRKQLGYVKRNIAYIETLLNHLEFQRTKEPSLGMFPEMKDPYPAILPLSKRDQKIYWVIQHMYGQQQYMYDNKTHSVKNRIVNIYQPYVRPIPRGKDRASTEFGAKISASEVDGMSRVEHISWNNFNESVDLPLQAEIYKTTFGHYPELILADQIYLNRNNRKWLKENNIRTVGKPLGRPPKQELNSHQKGKLKKERNQRNLIEGKFGQAKNAYGLGNIKAKRSDTSQSWISAIFFIMNLITLSKIAEAYAIFCAFFKTHTYRSPFKLLGADRLHFLDHYNNVDRKKYRLTYVK